MAAGACPTPVDRGCGDAETADETCKSSPLEFVVVDVVVVVVVHNRLGSIMRHAIQSCKAVVTTDILLRFDRRSPLIRLRFNRVTTARRSTLQPQIGLICVSSSTEA